jgi:beta-barrel assembly-enhancing protease
MFPRSVRRWFALLPGLLAWAGLVLPVPLAAQQTPAQEQLPEMGTAGGSALSLEDEYRLGRMVMRGLRESGQLVDDPEIGEYLQSVGLRLSSLAQDGNRSFNFFLVKDPAINAFALPGGFIGIHSGLLMETANESELAGVLSHEIAHVTQRHIARRLESQSRTSLVSAAAMLAAILLGSVAGGNASMGAVSAVQGLTAQQQINFTRENEYEADRVGIGTLAAAGFDPNAMPSFFDTMGRRTQLGPNGMPELLRTHPVTSARIAESKGRASQYPPVDPGESLSYSLMKERVRVLTTPAGLDPREYYESTIENEPDASIAQIYGRALAQVMAGDPASAIPALEKLRASRTDILQFHTALGQAQLAAGDVRGALATLEKARELAPRNVPVTMRYAEALMRSSRPKRAHEVLLDLFNNVPPTQDQIRQTAMAANAAGDVADAYSYMAEYHLMSADLPLAMNQLELALSVPNITEVQRRRYSARLNELREALPKERARLARPDEGDDSSRRSNLVGAAW